jgi:hypothetical protein
VNIEKRHLAHGFIDELIAAKRERRKYDPENAKRIARELAGWEASVGTTAAHRIAGLQ